MRPNFYFTAPDWYKSRTFDVSSSCCILLCVLLDVEGPIVNGLVERSVNEMIVVPNKVAARWISHLWRCSSCSVQINPVAY
jgi:hypothetical protein